jgi:sugar phosphate isomerase/epimerase
MGKVELVASYWTLSDGALPHTDWEFSTFDFRERVEQAARAGLRGMGMWHCDLVHVLKTRTLPEMRTILDANGMQHIEIEFLADWFLPRGERRRDSDRFGGKSCTCVAAARAAGHVRDHRREDHGTVERQRRRRGSAIVHLGNGRARPGFRPAVGNIRAGCWNGNPRIGSG